MGLAALLGLVGLALIDSTSTGTLIVPLLLLAHPRVRPARILLYLATIGGFYFLLGVALLLGADSLAQLWNNLDNNRTVDWIQLIVGAGLFGVSFWPETPWAKRAAAERAQRNEVPAAQRWVDRMAAETGRPQTIMAVALTAGLIEAASMLPYLGAIAIITTSGLSLMAQLGVLLAYVLVMTLPALLLLGLRMLMHGRIEGYLERISTWVLARMGGAMWWVIGIIGFLLAADAVNRLGLVG